MIKTTWQVIILAENLKASPDSEEIAVDLKRMFQTILSITYTSEVNINFCVHTDFDLPDLFETNIRYIDLKIPTEPSLKIFRLLHAGNAKTNYPIIPINGNSQSLELIEYSGLIRMSRLSTIQETFITCNKDVEFEKSIVLTFDHGNAFGIFKDKIEVQKIFNSDKQKTEIVYENTSIFKTIFNPKRTGNNSFKKKDEKSFLEESPYFTMDELAQSIQNGGFNEQKADLVIMLNCFMMSMDTLYALRDTVGYLVAPQTAICFYGYHYEAIFSCIAQMPNNVSAEELCRLSVLSIKDSPIYKKHPRYMKRLGLYGADLTVFQAKNITQLENKLFQFLLTADKELMGKIINLRKKLISISGTGLDIRIIDTIGLFEKLAELFAHNDYGETIQDLSKEIEYLMEGRKYLGDDLIGYEKMPINGTSNYVPFYTSDLNLPCFYWFYLKEKSEYAKQSKVTEFILKYYSI